MQPTSAFAAASSRLHADLMIIRLKRAGIPRNRISVIFPEGRKPNCALCWITGAAQTHVFGNEQVTVAGPLSDALDLSSEPALVRSFTGLGFSAGEACTCADLLARGRILVGVNTAEEPDAAIAWHTFRQLEAEAIAIGVCSMKPAEAASEIPLKLAV